MFCYVARSYALVLALTVLLPMRGAGQESELASRGPRFLRAIGRAGVELDASGAAVLRRRVSLDLSSVTLDQALKEITRQANLEISYSPRVVAVDNPVTVHARDITVAAALTEVLLGTPVDVSVTPGGQLALVPRVKLPPAPVDTGAVAGQVTDAASGSPIVGGGVSVEGTHLSVVTGADGRYRIGGIVPGTYIVRARYIGYTPISVSVTVRAGEEVTADFALAKAPQELSQVIVTGTIVPTEVKAVPTPVSVIRAEDIAVQRPATVMELFRQVVPGAVSWDSPRSPNTSLLSVRGASTLTPGTPQMKIFVDGIEAAASATAAVDPNSIERIEVLRGPQAAAIYGSEAIGGVVQIFTKHGDSTLTRPHVDAQAALGIIETPYAGVGGVLRQKYTASLYGGGPEVSYNLGAGYSHTGDWLPSDEQSAQSAPSVYGGVHVTRGVLSLDVSGRHYTGKNPSVFNPDFAKTGFSFYTKPQYQPQEIRNQTVGAKLAVKATPWWLHTISVGIDRYTQDLAQSRPRLTTPADTLLSVVNVAATKTSIGYNTAVQGQLAAGVSGSLTAGFDHWSLPYVQVFAFGALRTTGTITTAPGGFMSVARTTTNNTGYFAQAQVGLRDALFLTAGLRAEENSNFGDSLGRPLLPRVGLALVQPVGSSTLKVRGSWGRAIRAPAPGLALALVSAGSARLANPSLGPERQHGWDAGVDAVLGGAGKLSVTLYNQIADNLIQQVTIGNTSVPTVQAQNVGRVKNSGVEVEGALAVGPVQVKGQYGYARARIEQLAPGYTGDLRVGDQSFNTPKHTAGASLTFRPTSETTVAAGLTYVGGWTDYDYFAYFSCLGGTGPCRNASFALDRSYVTQYPGFTKANMSVTQQLTPVLAGFITVDNLTNNDAPEFFATYPVMGRITMVGVQLHR